MIAAVLMALRPVAARVQLAATTSELAAAALEAAIAALLAALCASTWRKSREPHFGWWAVAFTAFTVRIGMIIAFLMTGDRAWLFWHQVVTGWVAVALLFAAAAFVGALPRTWIRATLYAFPLAWSYVAIIQLENFTLAAVPAVIFIAAATLWTGIVLLRNRRRGTHTASTLLGWTFVVWGFHHLDYPLLRARGAWTPWGYYLDILFVLAVGAGILLLVNADLAGRLQARTTELEHLSRRMVRQHEDERRRLSLELHDETAQVFAAMKMQLGLVRERVAPDVGAHVDRALALVDEGLRGIRNVTNDLRPALLDDLGLLPALRSLVADFAERREASATFTGPEMLPVLPDEAEVALFRAVQESLTNVARHAPDAPVAVTIAAAAGRVRLEIADRGAGFDGDAALRRAESDGHLGIAGMRERIAAIGGTVDVSSARGAGTTIAITVAASEDSA